MARATKTDLLRRIIPLLGDKLPEETSDPEAVTRIRAYLSDVGRVRVVRDPGREPYTVTDTLEGAIYSLAVERHISRDDLIALLASLEGGER